jgi:Uma2 family endonuclease
MTLAIPESISDYELERGKPMPSRNHGALELLIGSALLMKYAKTHSVFTEVTLDTAPPLTPDVAVAYPKIDLDWTQDEVRMSSPPLLIVEILSPSQTLNELVEKTKQYFAAGVTSCWLVLPTYRLIAVHTADAEPRVFTEGAIDDPASKLSVTIEEIFQ